MKILKDPNFSPLVLNYFSFCNIHPHVYATRFALVMERSQIMVFPEGIHINVESVWGGGGEGAQRSHIFLGACSSHLGRSMFPLGLLQILFGHQSFLN